MRTIAVLLWLSIGSTACARDTRPADKAAISDSASTVSALRDSLMRAQVEDQAGRDSVVGAISRNDTAYLKRQMSGDSARTRWLQDVVAKHGWPRKSIYGDTAATAAWLIVQHSPSREFQEQMLPLLQAEAKRGEVRAADVAMLNDRVLVHRGKPQIYGTQFSMRNDSLIADSIADIRALDSLRASVGLPPMKEYARMLADMYKAPVAMPQLRQKQR